MVDVRILALYIKQEPPLICVAAAEFAAAVARRVGRGMRRSSTQVRSRAWAPRFAVCRHDVIVLLAELGISRAHLAGHSSGAAVAAQVALTEPEVVHTLTLLELSLLTLPLGQEFLAGVGPVFEIYERGDHEGAFAAFMTAVSGLDWDTCHEVLESGAPGVTAQSITDADTFFGVELPSLGAWDLTPDDAGSIAQPVLSVLGARTLPLWVEVAEYLRAVSPDLTDLMIDRAGHLLHVQHPDSVAEGVAQFLDRHQMARS